jgi:L-alanine-DL-glutamate epimerase-like enolase superfamily enzyme
MVQAEGLVFTPHTWTNGIGLVANLHCAAAGGNVPYIEFPYDPPNWTPEARDFIFREPLWIDSEGYVKVPDKPGLGLDLDEEKLAKYEVPERGQLI